MEEEYAYLVKAMHDIDSNILDIKHKIGFMFGYSTDMYKSLRLLSNQYEFLMKEVKKLIEEN